MSEYDWKAEADLLRRNWQGAQRRIAALEAELEVLQAECEATKTALRAAKRRISELCIELAEERARLAKVLQIVKAVRDDTLDCNIVVKVEDKIQFLTVVLRAAIDEARRAG